MSTPEAKQRASRAFEKVAQRQREADERVEAQRKADLSLAAKTKRLRELRLARDAAQALEAANAPAPKPKTRAKAKKAEAE